MTPFNWNAHHVIWWHHWRRHVAKAKENPAEQNGYCRAAMIAQAEYVCSLAIEMAKEKQS